jgi:type II secretion system protein L
MAASNKEQIVLHAGASRWSWRRLDRAGRVQGQGEGAPGEVSWPAAASVQVLMDASLCVGLRLALPRLSAGKQAQALRWAAEEHLASSAEDEHVVAGPRDADDRLCAVVVGQAAMRQLLEALGEQPVEQVVPDALCLPFEPGRVSLAGLDGRVLARWGDWDFGSFEAELIDELLHSLPGDSRFDWYGGDLPEVLSALPIERGGSDTFEALTRDLAQAPIDLLTGDYASDSSQAVRSHWRYAGIAAALVGVLALGSAYLELKLLQSRSATLATELDAQFAAAFPGVTPAGRHLEQAQRQLSGLRFGQAAGLLDLMNRAAPVIAAQADLETEALSFRDGRLEFVLRAPDGLALEDVARRLRALSLEADLQSLRREEGAVTGRLLLVQAGGA